MKNAISDRRIGELLLGRKRRNPSVPCHQLRVTKLVDYLVPENFPAVVEKAGSVETLEMHNGFTGEQRAIVIPVPAGIESIREAADELIQGLGLIKVSGDYMGEEEAAESFVGRLNAEGRASFGGCFHVEQPRGLEGEADIFTDGQDSHMLDREMFMFFWRILFILGEDILLEQREESGL